MRNLGVMLESGISLILTGTLSECPIVSTPKYICTFSFLSLLRVFFLSIIPYHYSSHSWPTPTPSTGQPSIRWCHSLAWNPPWLHLPTYGLWNLKGSHLSLSPSHFSTHHASTMLTSFLFLVIVLTLASLRVFTHVYSDRILSSAIIGLNSSYLFMSQGNLQTAHVRSSFLYTTTVVFF